MKMSPRSETCKLGKPFAIGGTAEIYDWEPGWALKLYFNRFQPWMADYERGKAAAICATGVPVQAVGEIVNVTDERDCFTKNVRASRWGKT